MQTLWLLIHALWVIWMVAGIVVAVVAIWKPRLWHLPVFRTTHLVGLLATATVPFWSDGICPITVWEASSGQQMSGTPEPFLIRLISELVYYDVPAWTLSVLTGICAIYCLFTFAIRPPWGRKNRRASG